MVVSTILTVEGLYYMCSKTKELISCAGAGFLTTRLISVSVVKKRKIDMSCSVFIITSKGIKTHRGERGGLVVESRTLEREVGGSILTWEAVLFPSARHIYSQKVLVIPRKRWLRHDMTEKLVYWDIKLFK